MLQKRELYCITTVPQQGMNYEQMVEHACEGGAHIIQFRYKGIVTDDITHTARNLLEICRHRDVVFIINDYPELARTIDADGVHMGQDDMPIAQARHVVGPGKLIGLSTHSYEQAMKGRLQGADYIGFGPVFSTPTKPDYKPVGMEEIRSVVQKVDIPVFVIGGIDADNVASVILAGADRVAVVRAVFGKENIKEAAAVMREQIAQAKKERMYQEI